MTEPGIESQAPLAPAGSNPELGLHLRIIPIREAAGILSDAGFTLRQSGEAEAAEVVDELWPYLKDIEGLFANGLPSGVWDHLYGISRLGSFEEGLPPRNDLYKDALKQMEQLKATLIAAYQNDLEAYSVYINEFLIAHPGLIELSPGVALKEIDYTPGQYDYNKPPKAPPAQLIALLSDSTRIDGDNNTEVELAVVIEKLPEACSKGLRASL